MDGIHLTTAHNPVDTRIFDKEATTLAESGFEVAIMGHDTPNESQNGVKFYDLGRAPDRIDRWTNILSAARWAKQLDASVYHFHDPELIPAGLYLSRTTDSAVIYDVHENYEHKVSGRNWIPSLISPALSYGIPHTERFAAKYFDGIVAATTGIEEKFSSVNSNTRTIHNFPRTSNIPDFNNYKDRTADHVLCYVGGLVDIRGLYRMLELVDVLLDRGVDVELWALGSWKPSESPKKAEEFINSRGLESRVRFPGFVEYDEMFRYLYSGDVGLSLLDVNQFQKAIPTKQFEYLYAGLPVVTTPIETALKYLPEEYRYIVPQENINVVADAVEKALDTDYDTPAMQSLVKEEYSWESEAKSLISLYDEFLR